MPTPTSEIKSITIVLEPKNSFVKKILSIECHCQDAIDLLKTMRSKKPAKNECIAALATWHQLKIHTIYKNDKASIPADADLYLLHESYEIPQASPPTDKECNYVEENLYNWLRLSSLPLRDRAMLPMISRDQVSVGKLSEMLEKLSDNCSKKNIKEFNVLKR
jgi:hypothetical protein